MCANDSLSEIILNLVKIIRTILTENIYDCPAIHQWVENNLLENTKHKSLIMLKWITFVFDDTNTQKYY